MSRSRRARPAVFPAVIAALVLAAFGASWIWHSRAESRALEDAVARARGLAGRGFFSRASRLLEPHSETLIKSAEGCELLISMLYNARRLEKCNRIALKCASEQHGTLEGILGSAEVYAETGQSARAATLLLEGFKLHEKNEKLAHALASALRRAGQLDEAAAAYLAAARLIPREQTGFSYEAMSFFSELSLASETRLMAERLKPEDFPDPERRLETARALLRSGAKEEAGVWVTSVRASLESDPEPGRFLAGRFPDLLGPDHGGSR